VGVERHAEDGTEENQHDVTYSIRAGGRDGPRIGKVRLGK
jgi:hypothetical protein